MVHQAYTSRVTADTFHALTTRAGQSVLAEATRLVPTVARYPACLDRLSRTWPRELSRAALDIVLLRLQAVGKFDVASRLYFTRDGFEMASGTLAAQHRATRYSPYAQVADLGCGIGGDTLELARVTRVTGYDREPLHAAMTVANLEALGLAGNAHAEDFLTADLQEFDAAFADPSRREGGRRTLGLEQGQPPLAAIRAKFAHDFPLGVKAAPGVSQDELAALDAECEFVSVAGELKECLIWFGPMRTAARRATLLPSGETLVGEASCPAPVGAVAEFIYDPDPAITRSGLVGTLAERIGAHAVTPGGAFLSGPAHGTPFAKSYQVEAVLPLKVKILRDYLRRHHVGRLTPIKRGVDVDSDALMSQCKLVGEEHRVLLLLRVAGTPSAIVAS